MVKVWIASEGNYSDYRVTGVFTTKAEAAKVSENDVESFTLYEKAPEGVMRYHMVCDVKRPIHPHIDPPPLAHFHTGDPMECFACNPGHAKEGPCAKCVATEINEHRRQEVLYPWSYNWSSRKRTEASSRRYQDTIRIVLSGPDRRRIEKAYHDRVAQAKAELEGL
jgi:hypothetical protein